MKKYFMFCVSAMLCSPNVLAQDDADSLRMEQLQEVVVKAVRGQQSAPFSTTKLNRQELADFSTTGKELPLLFSRTPGVLAWSENGLGTGTTYMRIRGAGDSRINVTLDGVPLNSPEDQCVFWANMNSYGSLLGNVHIQRGVGSSTNGDGAFGGTVALSSKAPALTPSGEASFSYGSYNTINVGASVSTGLLWNHLIIDGAYHQTTTDGFIHGTKGRSGSYYGGLAWYGKDFVIRYKNIGNFETTGQAWNGVTAGNDDNSLMDGSYNDGSWTYSAKTGIKTYEDLYKVGLGRFNSLYEGLVTDDNGCFVKDASGNYQTERYKMADGSFWDRATDNFKQNHNILSLAWDINEHWSTSGSLHYTYGYGYYEEFRPQNKPKKLGWPNTETVMVNTPLPKRFDWIRKKGLTQHTYGLVWNANYKNDRWDVIGGLSLQRFSGNHFGYATYFSDASWNAYIQQRHGGEYQYYDSDASKLDGSIFVKALYKITPSLDVFADMQYRHVGYKTDGVNDKFYEQNDLYYNQPLNVDEKYDFFNPKAGLSFHKDGHSAFASVAISHREPERNNYTDNGSYPAPRAERLTDWELGYNYTQQDLRLGVNLYYMKYTDQFVQTGELSDIGEALTTNIKDSYRMGVEASVSYDATRWLTLEANTALSRNRIKDFDEVVEDWYDPYVHTIHYDNSTLAFSPSNITNLFVDLHYRGFKAIWHTGFVSRMYLDNTENRDRSLPSYSTSDLQLSYRLAVNRKFIGLRDVLFGLNFNNVFNKHYAQSGWVYSAAISDGTGNHTVDNRYYQIGFISASGFTMMGSITVRF